MSSRPAKHSAPSLSQGETIAKKLKRDELTVRLESLKKTLETYGLDWEPYATDSFVKVIGSMRRNIGALSTEEVETYITDDRLDIDLRMLEFYTKELQIPPQDDMDPFKLEELPLFRDAILNYITRVQAGIRALKDQAQVKPTPVDFADHNKWRIYQELPQAILCLRPADKRGLPITLMHRAFCDFYSDFHDPPLDKHTHKYISIASKLCEKMPGAFDSARERQDAFEAIFAPLYRDLGLEKRSEFSIQPKFSSAKESSASVAKGINTKEGGDLILLLEVFKLEPTEDVYMEVCRTFEVYVEDKKNTSLLKFGTPMFLLCILGPYLMVCGGIKEENTCVEPLTPFLPMFPDHGTQGRIFQLAYCLQALKSGLDKLRGFWCDVGIIPDSTPRNVKFQHSQIVGCPDNNLLHFDNWKGTFESKMHKGDHRLYFIAKLHKDGQEHQTVVKFVYNYSGTYGNDVHLYLYEHNLAPRLFCAKILHRGLVMVVMERLTFQKDTEHWVELDTFEGKLDLSIASRVRTKLESVIDLLQGNAMVHADLRPRNIMIKVDSGGNVVMTENGPNISIIDFDWSGKVGETRYPPLRNPKVRWPQGAEDYQMIGKDDDRILLNMWWDDVVQGKVST